jgi:hypothetical protein
MKILSIRAKQSPFIRINGIFRRSTFILYYMKARTIFLLMACALIVTQCKPGGNKPMSGQSDTTTNVVSTKMTYLLPSPDEVLAEIISEKMSINPQLVNPRSSAPYYLDRKPLAMNLGVYISDFAYLNLNNNKTNALEYFKLIRDLCQKLNIYGVFTEAFFSRVQVNLMNNDSLNIIASDMYGQLSEILSNSNRLEDYAQISAGAIIEAFYLSAKSIPDYKKYSALVQKLFEQKMLLQNYYDFASQFKSDKEVNSALSQLDSIKVIFDHTGIKTHQRTVTKDKSNHLVIKGGDEITTDELTFIKFVKTISKIRQNIVKY